MTPPGAIGYLSCHLAHANGVLLLANDRGWFNGDRGALIPLGDCTLKVNARNPVILAFSGNILRATSGVVRKMFAQ